MINRKIRVVKFDELGYKAKRNCIKQYMNIMCAYDGLYLDNTTPAEIAEGIDLFVEACPGQYWFDVNGDWYDEGRKVKG